MTQSKLQTLQPKFHLKPMTIPQIPDLVQCQEAKGRKTPKAKKRKVEDTSPGWRLEQSPCWTGQKAWKTTSGTLVLESMALQFQQLRIVISFIQRFYFILKMWTFFEWKNWRTCLGFNRFDRNFEQLATQIGHDLTIGHDESHCLSTLVKQHISKGGTF